MIDNREHTTKMLTIADKAYIPFFVLFFKQPNFLKIEIKLSINNGFDSMSVLWNFKKVRVPGFEPEFLAWQARVIPDYTTLACSDITDTVPSVPGIWIYKKRLISFLDFGPINHDGRPFPSAEACAGQNN
jgi:hypothetical protein